MRKDEWITQKDDKRSGFRKLWGLFVDQEGNESNNKANSPAILDMSSAESATEKTCQDGIDEV